MKKIILSLSVIVSLSQTVMAQWTPAGNSITNNTQYLGTTNNTHLDFRTGTGAASTQRMRITNTGLIGIGTGFTTPGAALHLQSTTENLSFKIQTVGTNNAEMAFQSGSNASDILTYNNSTGLLGSVLRFNTLSSGTSLTYTSYSGTTATDFFRVNEAGNFGIGTITPSYKLHVKNTSLANGTAMRLDAINGQLRLFETDGSNPESYTQIERNGDAFHIYQRDITSPSFVHVLTAKMDGTIGFGTAAPEAALHILSNQNTSLKIETTTTNNADIVLKSGSGQSDILNYNASAQLSSILRFNDEGAGSSMSFTSYAFGASPVVNFKVASNGITYAKEIIVQSTPFPDYVFANEYKLMPLKKVSEFINVNHHLPNIPSAKEVETNGLALGDMQVKQMEKIEELYLYIIELDKKVNELSTENQNLKKAIEVNNRKK